MLIFWSKPIILSYINIHQPCIGPKSSRKGLICKDAWWLGHQAKVGYNSLRMLKYATMVDIYWWAWCALVQREVAHQMAITRRIVELMTFFSPERRFIIHVSIGSQKLSKCCQNVKLNTRSQFIGFELPMFFLTQVPRRCYLPWWTSHLWYKFMQANMFLVSYSVISNSRYIGDFFDILLPDKHLLILSGWSCGEGRL